MRHFFVSLIAFFALSCGSSNPTSRFNYPKVKVTFKNQSQFVVESVHIHDQVNNYSETHLGSMDPIDPGGSKEFDIPNAPWFVTVYRKPNKDASVLAYTTARAWDPSVHTTLIYFDEQFRSQ